MLQIRTTNQSWEWTGNTGAHASDSLYILNEIYSTQYIRIIDKTNHVFLFALYGLSSFNESFPTFVVQGINSRGQKWETGICFGWSDALSYPSAWIIKYYQYNVYNSASINMAIKSVEIGTLE